MQPLLLFPGIPLLLASIGIAWEVVRRAREKPSDFVAGVCNSLVRRPALWDYDSGETWLLSTEAHLAISLQDQNFGRCNSYLVSNQGSDFMMQFRGADLRAFRKSVRAWRELTAIERQHVVERRKREALRVIAAASF